MIAEMNGCNLCKSKVEDQNRFVVPLPHVGSTVVLCGDCLRTAVSFLEEYGMAARCKRCDIPLHTDQKEYCNVCGPGYHPALEQAHKRRRQPEAGVER